MAGQRLCGRHARRWVLQAPRPCALCQPHTSSGAGNTASGSGGYALPWRHCQLQKNGERGQEEEGRTGNRTPRNAASARALKAGTFCAFAELLFALPFRWQPWKPRGLRFARLAGRGDAGAGDRFPLRGAQLDCSVPPSRPPSPESPVPKRQGIAARPRPWRVIRSSWQKKVGEARLDLPSVCVRAGGSGRLCKATRQPWAPTSIHFCASEKAGSGGGSGCSGCRASRPRAGQAICEARRALELGGRDEDGRAAAAAAAGARSPPLPARRSLPGPPLPRPAQVPAESRARGCRTPPVSARRERARRRGELPLAPTFPGRPAPHPVGCQPPTKNNQERTLRVSLPARSARRRGARSAAPHVPAPGRLQRD